MTSADGALQQFAAADGFPREAMEWARAHWQAAAPRFIARLRAFAAGGGRSEAAEDQAFLILHLCGEMHETRAYEPLCRLIAEDADLDVWLGDAKTETLPGILINVFDGDIEPLTRAMEAPAGDESARGSALLALAYLTRARGALDDEAMRGRLRRLRREATPREIPGFWLAWGCAAAALGYDDLRMDIAILTKDGLLDPSEFGLDDFDELVALGRADPAGLAGFHDVGVEPLDDAIATLEAWSDEEDEDEEFDDGGAPFDDGGAPFDGPYVNPLRDIGRNDPCPCGSGKKYKKCCLAA